jgi:hypothetical protein
MFRRKLAYVAKCFAHRVVTPADEYHSVEQMTEHDKNAWLVNNQQTAFCSRSTHLLWIIHNFGSAEPKIRTVCEGWAV